MKKKKQHKIIKGVNRQLEIESKRIHGTKTPTGGVHQDKRKKKPKYPEKHI
jgi:hypothetical protein